MPEPQVGYQPYPMATNWLPDHLSQDESKVILFNTSKKELYTPTTGYKILNSRLKVHWTIKQQRDDISSEKLKNVAVVIFGLPREKFSVSEFNVLRTYIESGGSVLVMMSEGGEAKCNTNINFLLEEFGVIVNNDTVVRSVYHKYFHPMEALIANGVLNRELNRASGKSHTSFEGSLSFVYPYGVTLTAQKPSIAVLSSGSTSYPLNRPVCAFCSSQSGRGRLVVLGSAHMFSDSFINKEENEKVFNVILQWLTTDEIQLNQIDAEDPEVSDFHFLPDTSKAAEKVRTCLQESEEVLQSSMFSPNQFGLDTNILPQVIKAYDELHLKHETLSLITPKFEVPLPPLQPAVFPPSFHEIPPPSLDLFDLDEHFSSERVRLAQVTNKCTDEDLEFYVRECGQILGVNKQLGEDNRGAKDILDYIFSRIVEYKKFNQEPLGVITPNTSAVDPEN